MELFCWLDESTNLTENEIGQVTQQCHAVGVTNSEQLFTYLTTTSINSLFPNTVSQAELYKGELYNVLPLAAKRFQDLENQTNDEEQSIQQSIGKMELFCWLDESTKLTDNEIEQVVQQCHAVGVTNSEQLFTYLATSSINSMFPNTMSQVVMCEIYNVLPLAAKRFQDLESHKNEFAKQRNEFAKQRNEKQKKQDKAEQENTMKQEKAEQEETMKKMLLDSTMWNKNYV